MGKVLIGFGGIFFFFFGVVIIRNLHIVQEALLLDGGYRGL